MIVNGRALLDNPPIKRALEGKEKLHGVSHGLSEAGYDIRIKQTVEFKPYGPTVKIFDPITKVSKTEFGRFVIASAVEEFDMPNNLVGVVHDKSSWARQGLSVFNTVIEPGWKGFLTLELVYHGSKNLVIPAGCGIAQVLFHDLKRPAHYAGKYQNQANKPVEAILEGSV